MTILTVATITIDPSRIALAVPCSCKISYCYKESARSCDEVPLMKVFHTEKLKDLQFKAFGIFAVTSFLLLYSVVL